MDAPTETKKRGRPAKNEAVEPETPEALPDVVVPEPISVELSEPSQVVDIKHVFRTISASGMFVEDSDATIGIRTDPYFCFSQGISRTICLDLINEIFELDS